MSDWYCENCELLVPEDKATGICPQCFWSERVGANDPQVPELARLDFLSMSTKVLQQFLAMLGHLQDYYRLDFGDQHPVVATFNLTRELIQSELARRV